MRKTTARKLMLLTTAGLAFAAVTPAFAGKAKPTPTPTPTPTTSPTPKPTPVPIGSGTARAKPYSNLLPYWGKIRSFWGDASPLWGDTSTAWGTTGPYAQDLTPFWGKIRSFNDTSSDTVLLPSWGKIRSFAGDLGASWGKIRSFWDVAGASTDTSSAGYGQVAQGLQDMVDLSQTTFGAAVEAQTGQSFGAVVTQPLLAKYGIDLNKPSTLSTFDAGKREQFFLEWYDTLMNYTGADHVDHWMEEVNWSPALTQTMGGGKDATIGVLDFSITGAAALNVVKYEGISAIDNGHGTAVASLLVDPIDGKGVMGIAPLASVVSYNPFDATQTAGWTDIANGVVMLTKSGARIINMSLGVPGWTLNAGWNDVFQDYKVKGKSATQVFVIAAGNDGVSQTQNIVWKADNPQVIVVGSVDPTGVISSFSNQPGNACFTDDKGKCTPDFLKNHFMVAPGELILVSDGKGGVTRMSGTSFAAPLVSGTVALIQDRWPWLADHPKDVVGIIFKSAKDLGAPGIDPVYGNGELDVQAALSPLDWSKLKFKQVVNGKISDITLTALRATTAAQRSTWEANSVYFSLFEDTGESQRDFQVPMSSKLDNKTVSVNGQAEQFMGYLTSRFSGWLGAPTRFGNGATRPMGFTDLRGSSTGLPVSGDVQATLTMRPRVTQMGFRRSNAPFDTAMDFASTDGRFAVQFGTGQSAPTVGGQLGFGLTSDYDTTNGGANPFLGFASGGGYAHAALRVAPGLSIASGITQRRLERDLSGIPALYRSGFASKPYEAAAANMTVSYDAAPNLTTSVGYTMLREQDAVLGMGSSNPFSPTGGATTDSATLGADWLVTPTLSLSGAATMGRTRAGDPARQAFTVGNGGIMSTAFQVALAKQKVLAADDHLRLTFAQPMHVENGSVAVTMVEVVDRETGELGPVTQRVGISGPQRRYVAEAIYGRPLLDGRAEVSLFGRANLNARVEDQLPGVVAGTSVRLAF